MKHPGKLYPETGQALVELLLLLPILMLLVLGAFWAGWAMFTGSNASTAMQETMVNRATLADTPGDGLVAAHTLANGYASGGIGVPGQQVDTLTRAYQDNVVAVLQGRKTFVAPLPGASINFEMSAIQPVPASLLAANQASAATGTRGVLPNGLNAAFYSRTARQAGTVNPADYGLNASQLPMALPLVNATCGNGATVNVGWINATVSGADYQLAEFSAPATLPTAGAFDINYSAPTLLQDPRAVLNLPNAACDAPATLAKYDTECAASLSAQTPTTTTTPPTVDPTTGVTTSTTTASNSPSTGVTTTTVNTMFPAGSTGAPTIGSTPGTFTPAPNTTVVVTANSQTTTITDPATGLVGTETITLNADGSITRQTATQTSTPPPAGAGTGNVANPAGFASACRQKKQMACRLQWGNRYMAAVVAAMTSANACNPSLRTAVHPTTVTFTTPPASY